MKTTYVDQANTNAKVFEAANFYRYKPEQNKEIQSFEQYVTTKHNKILGHVIRQPQNAPHRQVAFHNQSFTPAVYLNRRVGRPRDKWAVKVAKRLFVQKPYGTTEQFKANPREACMKPRLGSLVWFLLPRVSV